MLITDDGTAIRDDSSVIVFSIERFIRDKVEGGCCFICGRSRGQVALNDEHIISDWILRRAGLHDREITLPNETSYRYAQYKVPCCEPCNGMMDADRALHAPSRHRRARHGAVPPSVSAAEPDHSRRKDRRSCSQRHTAHCSPLVDAGMDRIAHSWFVDGIRPVELAARARIGNDVVGTHGAKSPIDLLN